MLPYIVKSQTVCITFVEKSHRGGSDLIAAILSFRADIIIRVNATPMLFVNIFLLTHTLTTTKQKNNINTTSTSLFPSLF